MITSSKSDKTESMKQKLEIINEDKLKENDVLKEESELSSYKIEKTSCTEKNLKIEMPSKKLKKEKKI